MACAYARLVGGVLVGRSLAVRWRRQQSLQGGLTPRSYTLSLHASSRLGQLYFRGRILVLCKISVSLFVPIRMYLEPVVKGPWFHFQHVLRNIIST